ncbi:TPA: hypothetical protein ACNUVO_004024 [Aeromonas salmonicida subsp. pectinolytica]
MSDPFAPFQLTLARLTAASRAAHDREAGLLAHLEQLQQQLALPTQLAERAASSALAADAARLTTTLSDLATGWQQEWQAQAPMRALSEQLADRLVLLIYGKVNAGKSSLINHLAEGLGATLDAMPQGFILREGRLLPHPLPLAEGATETTREIAVILIGDKLALIDTPGLHSVTRANGELARRFTDSADALLWVTPSTNPGLIHELDALAAELTLGKPLLPVISRSDIQEERWDAASGQLIGKLVAKSPERRLQQENDLYLRAQQHLISKGELRQAISMSVACAKGDPESDHGLDRLGGALAALTEQALIYKPAKWQAQLDHFIQRNVIAPLEHQLQPALTRLEQALQRIEQALPTLRQTLQEEALITLLEAWPALVERHQQAQRRDQLLGDYQALREQTLAALIERHLAPLLAMLPTPTSLLQATELGEYRDRYITWQEPANPGKHNLARLGAGLLGGILGALGGPVVSAVSALAATALADKLIGSPAEQTRRDRVGCDNSDLLGKGSSAIEQDLQRAIETLLNQIRQDYLSPLRGYLAGVAQCLTVLPHSATPVDHSALP